MKVTTNPSIVAINIQNIMQNLTLGSLFSGRGRGSFPKKSWKTRAASLKKY